jgi:4'-phosphopantetheinyl transferase
VLVTPSPLSALKTDRIDLWWIDPAQLPHQVIDFLVAQLTESESANLAQFKNKKAKQTALITRSICRLVLSQYIGSAPNQLNFIYNSHGKPELDNNKNNIRFNLSHNNELIVIAVCADDDLGCDIENPQRKVSIEPITRRYFSQQEHLEIISLMGIEQQQRFFEIWTLKEAFVKATGIGISLGLNSFYFDLQQKNNLKKITVLFNSNYPLNQAASWEFHQTLLKQQCLAVCRASKIKQSIHFLSAKDLVLQLTNGT